MSREELTYLGVLLGSLPVGFLLKDRGPRCRQFGGAAVGAGLALLTCGPHTLHSIVTVLGTWGVLRVLPRHCGGGSLAWTFGYLLFFRTPWIWGLPEPPPFANALQLLITLKMVSLASDVQELRGAGPAAVTSEQRQLLIGSLRGREPGLVEILCYSYCYLGLLTGPFYRLGTFLDWVASPCPAVSPHRALLHARWAPALGALGVLVGRAWPAQAVLDPQFGGLPWLARLAHMVPVFLALRTRLYVGWLCAEAGCMAAGMGGYPKTAHPKPGQGPTAPWERPKMCAQVPEDQWDFSTIQTVDPWGTELGRRFRGGLRRWNMTVQWWLAAYVHSRGPRKYPVIRNAWTMLASAYWHGLHGGQHLAFLSVPLWLAAEAAAERALGARFGVPLERLGGPRGSLLRGLQWFLKMRAFEYLSVGFVLREAEPTLRFWGSVHFCLHLLPLALLGVCKGLGAKGAPGGKGGAPLNPKIQEERDPLNPKIQEERDLLNPKIHEERDPLNPKIHEGRDPLNPKIQEGRDPKIEEERDLLNPKIQEEEGGGDVQVRRRRDPHKDVGGDPLNPKIHKERDALNPKIQEGRDPQIQEGRDLLTPKFQEGGDAQVRRRRDPQKDEGGDPLNPKIQEGRDPKIKEERDPLNPKIHKGRDPQIQEERDLLNPKFQEEEGRGDAQVRRRRDPQKDEGGDPLNPKIHEGRDPKIHEGRDPKIQEERDLLTPKFQEEEGGGDVHVRRRDPHKDEGGDPLNPKKQEGGDPNNQEGREPLNPKIQEGRDPKIQEERDPLNPKIQEGRDPKIQEERDPLNPQIQEGRDPKIQEERDPLNPKIQEGRDPKIQEEREPLNPKIQEGRDPKIQEERDPLNPKIQEERDPLNPQIQEGRDPPRTEGGDPKSAGGDGPQ